MQDFNIINPYTQETLESIQWSEQKELDDILLGLKIGFQKVKKLKLWERINILNKWTNLIKENQEELGFLISTEMGKTLKDAKVEVVRSLNTIGVTSSAIKTMSSKVYYTDSLEPLPRKRAIVERFPVGNILAITPFNFPINLALHKIAPAFAMGNTVVLKPNPQTYRSTRKLVELGHLAGIPREALALCLPPNELMKSLVESPVFNAISFTGGTETAKKIAKSAGMKKLLFELGGNDPLIVFEDGNIEKAVNTVIAQRFGCAGQRCTASKRVFVHKKVKQTFTDLIVEKTQSLKVGDPLDLSTDVGPVVSENSAIEIERRIKLAVKNGATLLAGGKREKAVVFPTILTNIEDSEEVVFEETFGPVVPIFEFSSVDEVVERVNQSCYGLQAGVFTNNLEKIEKLFKDLEVGALAINEGPGFRADHIPFGGVKDSGLGREGVISSLKEMSVEKVLYM